MIDRHDTPAAEAERVRRLQALAVGDPVRLNGNPATLRARQHDPDIDQCTLTFVGDGLLLSVSHGEQYHGDLHVLDGPAVPLRSVQLTGATIACEMTAREYLRERGRDVR